MEKVQINLASKCKSYKPNNYNIYLKGLNFTENAKTSSRMELSYMVNKIRKPLKLTVYTTERDKNKYILIKWG